MAMKALLRDQFLYVTATVFPSVEYADEKSVKVGYNPEGMVPTGPPVWRSQVESFLLLNSVRKRLSGEKLSCRASEFRWDSKTLSRLRVIASRTSTVPDLLAAMSLLHGDHATSLRRPLSYAATIGSHEIGNPCTTLATGLVYCLYSSRTIDFRGDRRRAE